MCAVRRTHTHIMQFDLSFPSSLTGYGILISAGHLYTTYSTNKHSWNYRPISHVSTYNNESPWIWSIALHTCARAHSRQIVKSPTNNKAVISEKIPWAHICTHILFTFSWMCVDARQSRAIELLLYGARRIFNFSIPFNSNILWHYQSGMHNERDRDRAINMQESKKGMLFCNLNTV